MHFIQTQLFTLKLNWKSYGLVHNTSGSFSNLEHGECLSPGPHGAALQPPVLEARQILSRMRKGNLECKSVRDRLCLFHKGG